MGRAACGTNVNSVIDLSTWTTVQYDIFLQPDASWIQSDANTVVVQSVNGDASILLSPFVLQSDQIQGSWQVITNEDDDFMGFVFGYQDDRHFYLFDWKQYYQNNTDWGASQQGMSVKAVHAATPLTAIDLGTTVLPDASRVTLLYHNNISWEHFTNYDFTLEFNPGQFKITVASGASVLDTIVINDSTYTNGRFGFYNFSQSMVRYSGFTRGFVAARPHISVQDNAVLEGNLGTTDLPFAVGLSGTNCEVVMVDYVISSGTATPGVDYVPIASGTVVFTPGETNRFVSVPVIGDTLDEPDETFFITLSNPVGGLLDRARATGTIIDDDSPPSVRFEKVSILEGDSGSKLATFTFTLSAASAKSIWFNYSTANGSATAGSDYAAAGPGLVTFLPGQTTASVAVSVFGDTLVERDETFFICLANPVNVLLPDNCAVGTIINDDGNLPPHVQITRPADGAVFYTPPGRVVIEASAWDTDGYVDHVEFFSGTTSLGAVPAAPWIVGWTNNVPGTYTLTAIATDNDGAKGTSSPVNIIIRTCDTALTATPLTDLTRCLCDAAEFGTVVSSAEPVSFLWRANGVALPGETNRVLLLTSLKPSQAGLYTVEISTPCAVTTRSAMLTLRGTGDQNPASFTNAGGINIPLSGIASVYPSTIFVECVPGRVKHVTVTLDGLSHSSPDDIDVLLVSPGGQSVKVMSDCGGFASQKLTNVVITLSDAAPAPLPDSTRILSGIYKPTNYGDGDAFPPPAPAAIAGADFASLAGIDPNGTWSLFIVDDQGGDSGNLARGWSLGIEWEDVPPRLTAPTVLADGRFQTTLVGVPHMTHVIEASFNLATWIPIATNTLSGPGAVIIDPASAGQPYRFYRAIRCP